MPAADQLVKAFLDYMYRQELSDSAMSTLF